jgi:hypothetical protein
VRAAQRGEGLPVEALARRRLRAGRASTHRRRPEPGDRGHAGVVLASRRIGVAGRDQRLHPRPAVGLDADDDLRC